MVRPTIIHKTAADLRVPPNLADYRAERASFSWETARTHLDGLPRRWAEHRPRGRRTARPGPAARPPRLPLPRPATSRADVTYADLDTLTNRFANVLRGLGVGRGDVLFVLTGRIPELYIAVLGSLKNGTTVSPLFAAFGPEPIATRLNLGRGSVLVTTATLYERKIARIRDRVPRLRHVWW